MMALLFKVGQPFVCVTDNEVVWTVTGVIVYGGGTINGAQICGEAGTL